MLAGVFASRSLPLASLERIAAFVPILHVSDDRLCDKVSARRVCPRWHWSGVRRMTTHIFRGQVRERRLRDYFLTLPHRIKSAWGPTEKGHSPQNFPSSRPRTQTSLQSRLLARSCRYSPEERWPTLPMAVFSRYFTSHLAPQSSTPFIAINQDLVARDEHLRENLKAEAHTLREIVLTEVRLPRIYQNSAYR